MIIKRQGTVARCTAIWGREQSASDGRKKYFPLRIQLRSFNPNSVQEPIAPKALHCKQEQCAGEQCLRQTMDDRNQWKTIVCVRVVQTHAVVAFMARSPCMRNNAVTGPSTQINSEELEKVGKEDSGII